MEKNMVLWNQENIAHFFIKIKSYGNTATVKSKKRFREFTAR